MKAPNLDGRITDAVQSRLDDLDFDIEAQSYLSVDGTPESAVVEKLDYFANPSVLDYDDDTVTLAFIVTASIEVSAEFVLSVRDDGEDYPLDSTSETISRNIDFEVVITFARGAGDDFDVIELELSRARLGPSDRDLSCVRGPRFYLFLERQVGMSDNEEDDAKKQATALPLPDELSSAKDTINAALPELSAKLAALAMPELGINKLAAQTLPDITSAKLEALSIPSASRALTDALRLAETDHFSQATQHLSMFQGELDIQKKLTLALQDPLAGCTKLTSAAALSESILKDIGLQQEALRSAIGASFDVDKFLGTESLRAAREQINLASIHAAAFGPLTDLRNSGILDHLATAMPATSQISQMLDAYESRYRLPELDEYARLTAQLSPKSTFAGLYLDEAMQAATIARSPWLEIENSLKSAAAFAELQGLGQAIKHLEPFGSELLRGMRVDLGDWRDKISFPESLFGDLQARSDFYIERGLRVELAGFPAAAFEESLESAELVPVSLTLVDLYGEPIEPDEDEDSSAFTRTNRAHMWLMRLEIRIRQFIDLHLTTAFGPNWVKSQLVGDQYEKWQDKKKKAEAAGRSARRLIEYADFTDYGLIICRGDNWKVFQPFFKDPANIRESLQRLALPRIETMHARPLSQVDELLLFAELKRLGRVLLS